MNTVGLHFTLAGKTDGWKRQVPKEQQLERVNEQADSYVRRTVESYFGDRSDVEARNVLSETSTYPLFYAAGWFFSQETHSREMVVVGHGSTMDLACKAMMDCVKSVDWDRAVPVNV